MAEFIESNVSQVWLQAIALANASPKKEVSNLIVSVENLQTNREIETVNLRSALDEALELDGKFAVQTVASTIFPSSLWDPAQPRDVLFQRYLKLWPRITSHKLNRRGTYFQRLIGYPSPKEPMFNQLEFVISAFNSGTRRRSALQCGILVPQTDLNPTPYQGFPCMQQVAFIPDGTGGLRVSALYPMHYLCARAYGNYLGLINLGRFMASEMRLELRAMTCVALVAKLDLPQLARPFIEAEYGDTTLAI